MEKLVKFPWNLPFYGLLVGFALLITGAILHQFAITITGLIVLHLFGWLLAVKFILCITGFYSSVLGNK